MLSWALVFFVFSLIAAIFGFSSIAAASAGVAQILFYIFIALFVFSLLTGLVGRDRSLRNKKIL